MCVSAASTFQPRVRIRLHDQIISGQTSLKILGVSLDQDCTFKTHIECLRSKLRSRTWVLAKLRKNGLPEDKLIRAYTALIRPAIEYASPAWHSMITSEQSERLERQQTQALKNIFGTGIRAGKMRSRAELPTLFRRREDACLKFAKKCIGNVRCSAWFRERPPSLYHRRKGTTYPKFYERTARTDRFRNSPKNYLLRRLNSSQ